MNILEHLEIAAALAGMRRGKSVVQAKMMAEYLRRNPTATVARWTGQGFIVEKPITGEIIDDPNRAVTKSTY